MDLSQKNNVYLASAPNEPFAELVSAQLLQSGFTAVARGEFFILRRGKKEAVAKALVIIIGANGLTSRMKELQNLAQDLGVPVIIAYTADASDEVVSTYSRENPGIHATFLNRNDGYGFEELSALVKSELMLASVRGEDKDDLDLMLHTLLEGPDTNRRVLLNSLKSSNIPNASQLANALIGMLFRNFVPPGDLPKDDDENYNQVALARSWLLSALVAVAPEVPGAIKIFERTLSSRSGDFSRERFWLLAELIERRVPYLQTILESIEPGLESDVSCLATLARNSAAKKNAGLIAPFLHAADINSVRNVLRALRIIPVPALAPQIKNIFLKGEGMLAHELIHVLCIEDMARRVVPSLEKTIGARSVVTTIVEVANESSHPPEHFFVPFNEIPRPKVLHELSELRKDSELGVSATQLHSRYSAITPPRASFQLAGFAPDSIYGQVDQLDITGDVKTLTSIMLARDIRPPLAIGLFGDWGSGKSFFMHSMREEAERLSTRAHAQKASPFCSDVLQIEFNAWHYIDSNLWASLVSCILEKLSARVNSEDTPEVKASKLLEQLSCAKAIHQQAEAEEAAARIALEEEEKQLNQIRQERHTKELALANLTSSDILALIGDDDELKSSFEAASKALGVPVLLSRIEDVKDVASKIQSLHGRTVGLLRSTLFAPGIRWYILALFLGLLAVPAATAFLIRLAGSENYWWTQACALVTQISVVLGSATLWVRKGLEVYDENLTTLENGKSKVDKLIAQRLNSPSEDEISLAQSIDELKVREKAASAQVQATAERVAEIQVQVQTLKRANSLSHFLAERSKSSDYLQHLGLISLIRRDFEELAKKLQGPTSDDMKPVERIVLYIDDLDRCPPEKVADVLQAVHLLLAYPLFVVVVGVDARWLLHSLSKKFAQFENGPTESKTADGQWASTPQHYLEKIFQIPFALRPMNSQGFEGLVGSLLQASPPTQARESVGQAPSPQPSSQPSKEREQKYGLPTKTAPSVTYIRPGPVYANGETLHSILTRVGALPLDGSGRPGSSSETPGEVFEEVDEQALVIQPWEVEFAKQLHRFILSPRAAKRFTNIYRILKARVPHRDLATYEGSMFEPGEFRVPMLLLAILTNNPQLASKWFPLLMLKASRSSEEANGIMTNQSEFDEFSTEKNAFNEIVLKITEVERDRFVTGSLLRQWIPIVSRFSFDLSRHLGDWGES